MIQRLRSYIVIYYVSRIQIIPKIRIFYLRKVNEISYEIDLSLSLVTSLFWQIKRIYFPRNFYHPFEISYPRKYALLFYRFPLEEQYHFNQTPSNRQPPVISAPGKIPSVVP